MSRYKLPLMTSLNDDARCNDQTLSLGLRRGCSLSATLFSLFIDGLHHYLETAVPTAGIQILQMRLREPVYAEDICLLAPSLEQALIDPLAAYCANLQMGISVPKTKVMVVSVVPAPVVTSTCNPLEQVATFKYLGLISISQALLHTSSCQSCRRLGGLRRRFSGVIHCFSVAIPSTCICICCNLSWCLSYSMGVRPGLCIALVLLLLTTLALHYNA